jgi:hypothetical protein
MRFYLWAAIFLFSFPIFGGEESATTRQAEALAARQSIPASLHGSSTFLYAESVMSSADALNKSGQSEAADRLYDMARQEYLKLQETSFGENPGEEASTASSQPESASEDSIRYSEEYREKIKERIRQRKEQDESQVHDYSHLKGDQYVEDDADSNYDPSSLRAVFDENRSSTSDSDSSPTGENESRSGGPNDAGAPMPDDENGYTHNDDGHEGYYYRSAPGTVYKRGASASYRSFRYHDHRVQGKTAVMESPHTSRMHSDRAKK